MDIFDRASELEDRQRQHAITAARAAQAPARLQPTGHCRHCHEPTAHIFCDEHCREDFEVLQRAHQRNGARRP